MDKNIIFDTGKSSRINKRASQDGTLIKEAGIVEFVINRNEDNTFTNSSKPTKSFSKRFLCLNTKDHLKHHKHSFNTDGQTGNRYIIPKCLFHYKCHCKYVNYLER